MTENLLDLRLLPCPMPIIRLKKKVDQLNPGDSFQFIGDDPEFQCSLDIFCKSNNVQIELIKQEDNIFYYSLKKL